MSRADRYAFRDSGKGLFYDPATHSYHGPTVSEKCMMLGYVAVDVFRPDCPITLGYRVLGNTVCAYSFQAILAAGHAVACASARAGPVTLTGGEEDTARPTLNQTLNQTLNKTRNRNYTSMSLKHHVGLLPLVRGKQVLLRLFQFSTLYWLFKAIIHASLQLTTHCTHSAFVAQAMTSFSPNEGDIPHPINPATYTC